jgi:molybdopterin biosynthesis enzyme
MVGAWLPFGADDVECVAFGLPPNCASAYVSQKSEIRSAALARMRARRKTRARLPARRFLRARAEAGMRTHSRARTWIA